jgi:hypothetical protein
MCNIFHQLPMQVSQYCNGAFTITRIFKWEGKSFQLSVIGAVRRRFCQKVFGIRTCCKILAT